MNVPNTLERTTNTILNPRGTGIEGTAHTLTASPETMDVKLARRESAAKALGTITRGIERHIVTKGQFSLIDIIRKILDQTGPADMHISTWTTAGRDLAETDDLLHDGRLKSAKWLLDHTFQRRKPHFCGQLRKIYGDDNIRMTKNHAKLVVLRNDHWNVTVLTSMNLNLNPRMEFLLIRESKELAEFNVGWIEDVFARKKPGTQFAQTHASHEREFMTDD